MSGSRVAVIAGIAVASVTGWAAVAGFLGHMLPIGQMRFWLVQTLGG